MYHSIKRLLTSINVFTPRGQINKQAQRILSKYPDVLREVIETTSFLFNEETLRGRLYAINTETTSAPRCKMCNTLLRFNASKGVFNTYCSNNTGKSCAMEDVDVEQKRTAALLANYNVTNAMQNRDVRVKRSQTISSRYNSSHPMQNTVVRTKHSNTLFQRYGVDAISAVPGVIDKRKETNTARYGAPTYAQSKVSTDSVALLGDYLWCKEQIENFTVDDIATRLSVSSHTVRKYLKLHDLAPCDVVRSFTAPETEIQRWLTANNIRFIANERTLISPKQLDIYLPEYKLAIEYNGVYFHSELAGRGRNYHRYKTTACNEKGIRLIHIFSGEWERTKEIVISRIANAVGASRKIAARKCEVRSVDNAGAQLFFTSTHIQQHVKSSIVYGLYHDGMLVAAISFGKSRFTSKYQWELLRYSTATGVTVVGGCSKLLAHFKKIHDPQSIVSYCDLRWGNGNMYKQIGLSYSHTSPPNYYYFNRNGDTSLLLSRQNFQKHKLQSKLKSFNPDLSEWENMKANGYDRIWDCGNHVFIWRV